MFIVIMGLLTHGSFDWPTGQHFIVSYYSLWVCYPSVMITNLTLGFTICGGASPSLSTVPICNSVYFCSLTITALVFELCPSIFYWREWYGGSNLFFVYAVPASCVSLQKGRPPSLASLLTTPLASLGPSKTTPLVLSSALPLILGKVVKRYKLATMWILKICCLIMWP